MKMSKLGLSTNRNRLQSEDSLSLRIMLQACLIHRYGSGIYGLHNLLVRSLEKTKHIIRTVLESYDCVEMFWKYFNAYKDISAGFDAFESKYVMDKVTGWCDENGVNYKVA